MYGDWHIRSGLLFLSLLICSPVLPADTDYDSARQLRESGDILPLETILKRLEKSHPGKVLEVEMESRHGQLLYEIELLDKQGKVWELMVDPRSGEIIRQKTEH
jgi:uncharacterized membrane protein YkoI